MICRHYIIEGVVQGVFFRASTRDQAIKNNLQGWVRNRPDGSVEAVACGSESQLATFEVWLKMGPPMASVNRVTIEREPQATEFSGFEIR